MAREATITFEQVSAAANDIIAKDGKATSRNVREVLGSGSMVTVCKLMQQWKAAQAKPSQAVDSSIDPAILRAISNQIAAKVQEATSDATARLADLQGESETIIAESERQAAEIEAQAADLSAMIEQRSALAGRIQQLEAESERITENLVSERKAGEAARVELAKAALRLEAVPKIEATIEKISLELLQVRAHSAELHETAAVVTAKLEAEIVQRKITEAHLVESAAREIATAKEVSSKALADAKRSGEEAAELRGKLATMKIKPVAKKSAPLIKPAMAA